MEPERSGARGKLSRRETRDSRWTEYTARASHSCLPVGGVAPSCGPFEHGRWRTCRHLMLPNGPVNERMACLVTGWRTPTQHTAAGGTVQSRNFHRVPQQRPSTPPSIAGRGFVSIPKIARRPTGACHELSRRSDARIVPCAPNDSLSPYPGTASTARALYGPIGQWRPTEHASVPAGQVLGPCWGVLLAGWLADSLALPTRLVGSASESYPEMRSAAVKQHRG